MLCKDCKYCIETGFIHNQCSINYLIEIKFNNETYEYCLLKNIMYIIFKPLLNIDFASLYPTVMKFNNEITI